MSAFRSRRMSDRDKGLLLIAIIAVIPVLLGTLVMALT